MNLKGAFGHWKTIAHHRRKVMVHCAKAGILWQGLRHDLSKYTPTEFLNGARYYQGYRSPNERERECKGYSTAWMHHKGRNRHHFEYWTDYDPKTRQIAPIPMPMKYVAEMFCDRLAASKIYKGDSYNNHHPLEYFLSAKKIRIIHPKTSELLEELLILLSNEGEAAAFARLRTLLKENKA